MPALPNCLAASRANAWILGAALAVCLTPPLRLAAQEAEPKEHAAPAAAALDWKLDSSFAQQVPLGRDFYVRLRIKAGKSAAKDRQAIALAVVFDRSGSMNEDAKIGYVRKAGYLVADNLSREDYLAFVAFNHEVQTLVPLHPVVNREYLHHRIDELHAEGYTNLSGGLLEGCAQLGKRLAAPGSHHVILLTDGLANRGVIDVEGLVRVVQTCAKRGITVSTIGVGAEFNEKLLARMAEAGGGRYTYVAKPDQIPKAVEQELGALLDVVAQNARLKLEPPPGVELLRVFGHQDPIKPGVAELLLGDFASREERVLLLKLRASATAAGGELRFSLRYDDVASVERVDFEQALPVPPAANGPDSATAENATVLMYAQLVEAVDKIGVAVLAMDRRLAGEALAAWQRQFPVWKAAAQASRDQDFVNKAFLFEHYVRDVQALINRGALHDHNVDRAALEKDLHYRLYLLEHQRHAH